MKYPEIKKCVTEATHKNANPESLNKFEYDRTNLLSIGGIFIFIKFIM